MRTALTTSGVVAARCLRSRSPPLPARAPLCGARARPLAPGARRRALHCARACASGGGNGDSAPASPAPWGVGFSAAGLLFPYYVGVAETLQRQGILTGARACSPVAVSALFHLASLNTPAPSPRALTTRPRRRHDADGGRVRRLAHRRRAGQRPLHPRGAP
jgi:hypothetical protein